MLNLRKDIFGDSIGMPEPGFEHSLLLLSRPTRSEGPAHPNGCESCELSSNEWVSAHRRSARDCSPSNKRRLILGARRRVFSTLGKLEGLRVIPRGSAFQFKGKRPALRKLVQLLRVSQTAARDLSAGTRPLLETSFHRASRNDRRLSRHPRGSPPDRCHAELAWPPLSSSSTTFGYISSAGLWC